MGKNYSYIQKILKNKAVLGEFQPHRNENKKSIKAGDAILDYFPQIISEEVYYAVQKRMKTDRSIGGKTGKISNLFGGLAKCAYCGASMQIVNKGKPPKGGTYLVCDRARRGLGCEYHSVKYLHLS